MCCVRVEVCRDLTTFPYANSDSQVFLMALNFLDYILGRLLQRVYDPIAEMSVLMGFLGGICGGIFHAPGSLSSLFPAASVSRH